MNALATNPSPARAILAAAEPAFLIAKVGDGSYEYTIIHFTFQGDITFVEP